VLAVSAHDTDVDEVILPALNELDLGPADVDLYVIDLGMPHLDGVEVIEGLRGWTGAPILVVSGRTDSVDKVQALDAGADDYVTDTGYLRLYVSQLRKKLEPDPRRRGSSSPSPAWGGFQPPG
jgi:CheY-like chemotaxis protein